MFLNIQISELDRFLAYIPRDRQVVTVSNHAGRAARPAGILLAAGFNVVGPVGVEDAGEPIVVTARNRQENLNDVPIPISVLDGETVAKHRVFTIADLALRAPGLTATTPNARRTSVSLRGIG